MDSRSIVDGKATVVCNGLLRDWASWIAKTVDPATVHEGNSRASISLKGQERSA